MRPTSKLRVVTSDSPDALDVIRHEVEGATGLAVEPEIQEIDGADLVVELRLVDSSAVVPGLVARAVERSTGGLDVLSTWNERGRIADPAPVLGQVVLDDLDHHLPPVVRRALRDDLPTAHWSATGTSGAGDAHSWQLAVPVVRPDGRSVVGYQRRRGYSIRFGTHDVDAARADLAS